MKLNIFSEKRRAATRSGSRPTAGLPQVAVPIQGPAFPQATNRPSWLVFTGNPAASRLPPGDRD